MLNESIATRMGIADPGKIQLYSAETANGLKVHVALEEIIEMKRNKGDMTPFDYEPHTVRIRSAENHTEWFKEISLAQKIPVIVDPHPHTTDCDDKGPLTLSESGAILMYLGETYGYLLPTDIRLKFTTIQWVLWSSTEFSVQCKLVGFYYKYCTHQLVYCTERAVNKVKRLLSVLEQQLESHKKAFVIGDCYTIADISIFPWIHSLYHTYDDIIATKFDQFQAYPNVRKWHERCITRPASVRALDVCVFQDMPGTDEVQHLKLKEASKEATFNTTAKLNMNTKRD